VIERKTRDSRLASKKSDIGIGVQPTTYSSSHKTSNIMWQDLVVSTAHDKQRINIDAKQQRNVMIFLFLEITSAAVLICRYDSRWAPSAD